VFFEGAQQSVTSLDREVPSPGSYRLVISNRFSVLTGKTVRGEVARQVDRMIPQPAKKALAKAESALTQTVAAVRQSAVDTARQAGSMASTAQSAVEQQASAVMDQAKDFVKRVGESVGNIVESGTSGDAKK